MSFSQTTVHRNSGPAQREPAAKPEKLAASGLLKVELALDLAGWKPALLDGATDVPVRWASGLPLLGSQENANRQRRGVRRRPVD